MQTSLIVLVCVLFAPMSLNVVSLVSYPPTQAEMRRREQELLERIKQQQRELESVKQEKTKVSQVQSRDVRVRLQYVTKPCDIGHMTV